MVNCYNNNRLQWSIDIIIDVPSRNKLVDPLLIFVLPINCNLFNVEYCKIHTKKMITVNFGKGCSVQISEQEIYSITLEDLINRLLLVIIGEVISDDHLGDEEYLACESLMSSSSFYFDHQPQKPLRLNISLDHYINESSLVSSVFSLSSHDFGLVGGKGGFGSLLKQSKSKTKTTNFSAMRDLRGRRFKHITNQINMQKWTELVNKKKQEIKEKKAKEREEKRERARQEITIQKEIAKEKEELVAMAVNIGFEQVQNKASSQNNNTAKQEASKRKSKFVHNLSDDEE